jgi:hypothetical protein
MSTNVAWNGTTYAVPATGEENWGGTTKVDGLLIALATYGFQRSGGLFTLSADVDFGTSAGVKSIYYKSRGTVADAGVLRLAKTESIAWRNNADGGNNTLATDTSDRLLYNGVVVLSSAGVVAVAAGGTGLTSYTTGDLLYASGSTTLAKLAIGTANKVLTSTGSAPAWNLIVNANVDAAAAIVYSKLSIASGDIAYAKLATLNTGQIVVGSGGTPTAVTMGGDMTVDATGAITIGTKKVGATKLDSGAASSGDVFTADGSGGGSYAAQAAAPNQSYELTNLGLACSVSGNALTISLKQKDGSTAPGAGTAAVKIGFRDATSATGDFVQRTVTSALTTVISSGSTAGFTSATNEYLYVYAIDNAGTVELGWVGGGPVLDEQSVQSSTAEGGAGAADTRYTFYSTTSRSSKAVRLIARLKFSLTTAGTWDEVPDEIALAPFDTRIAIRSRVLCDSGNGHGATSTKIRRFTNSSTTGTAITYSDDANTGGKFTINEEGLYFVSWVDYATGGATTIGLSLNSSNPTTIVSTLAVGEQLVSTVTGGANTQAQVTHMGRFKPGDVIRAHDNGATMAGSDPIAQFQITKIAA